MHVPSLFARIITLARICCLKFSLMGTEYKSSGGGVNDEKVDGDVW
jgi:hypothetical protein